MNRKIYKIREYIFMIILTIASFVLLFLSFQIFMKNPKADSAGTFPLFASGMMVICCIFAIFKVKQESNVIQDDGKEQLSIREIVIEIFKNEMPMDVVIMIIIVIIYGMLIAKLGFYITTGIFLITSMCYIGKGKIKRAIITTGISLIIIWLIIDCVFKVALP